MNEIAVVLADTGSNNVGHIIELLQFFGIGSRVSTVDEFMGVDRPKVDSSTKVRLFCSSDGLGKLLDEVDDNPGAIRWWGDHVHSVFVYAGNDASAFKKVAMRIIKDGHTSLIQMNPNLSQWIICDKMPEFCGAMSGLQIPIGEGGVQTGSVRDGRKEAPNGALDEHGSVFLKVTCRLVPLFFSAASKMIDIGEELATRNFDIRNHFLSAAPIVMFVKWAFADMCWESKDVNACLIIDDPLLRPQYGFLNYQNVLHLMDGHNFTTNIAFIPWNWRRSDSTVASMFRSHPERYSLSVHGCDHTAGEYGTQNVDMLVRKSRQAIDRMSRHEAKTGIPYDRIMVFPQGVFSTTSMAVLKRAHFIGAVNTEVLSTDLPRPSITISDVWDVAVMKYENFPIFTRRYPSQGVENFAFDILLGKPCLIVVHHDYCQKQCERLVDLIERLHALNCRLSWCNLGEVVRRSCRKRELSLSMVEVEMYGSELRLGNRSQRQRRYFVTKRESDASTVKEIRAGDREIPWEFSDGRIHFEIEMAPGHSTMSRITFHDYPDEARYQEKTGYKLKVMLRRYLSEVRDNYVIARRT